MTGWTKQPLSKLATRISDGSHNPPKGVEISDFMMLSSKNVFDDALTFDAPRYLSATDFEQENRRTSVSAGDVLLTIVGTIGRCAVVPEDSPPLTLQRSVAVICPNRSEIESRFLMYSLMSGSDTLNAKARGVAQKGIYLETLREFDICHPPLPEQRRIVEILDEAFEAIGVAKGNAEKNLQNAREVFNQQHDAIFLEHAEDTNRSRLGDLATFRNGVNFTKRSNGRTVQIIGVKDFQNHFWVPLDDLDTVTLDGDLSPIDAVSEGDILTVRSNGNPELIGRCMVVGTVSEPVTHSGFTIRISLNRAKAAPSYICQFLRSRRVRRKLIDGGNGLNIKSLNQGMLAEIHVPLPPLEAQSGIVAKIEAMATATHDLAELATSKLAALDELKKSLLHHAFTGQLTAKKTDQLVGTVA